MRVEGIEDQERHAVVRAAVAQHPKAQARELVAATGIDRHKIYRHLQIMMRAGEVEKVSTHPARYRLAGPVEKTARPSTRGGNLLAPLMRSGEGESFEECVHRGECLTEWIDANPHSGEAAHCPPKCAAREDIPRNAKLWAAMRSGEAAA